MQIVTSVSLRKTCHATYFCPIKGLIFTILNACAYNRVLLAAMEYKAKSSKFVIIVFVPVQIGNTVITALSLCLVAQCRGHSVYTGGFIFVLKSRT